MIFSRIAVLSLLLALLLGCTKAEPPLDSNGYTPQQVLLTTYIAIVEGRLDDAKANFSPTFIETMITKNNSTFAEYCKNIEGWQVEWLKTKLMGNDYNDELWRVKVIPDEGKGKENRPGIVQDLALIDGQWKVVFWGNYPKS